nr:iron chelate uptake ABC transporter family permease subunit [Microbacterium ulmi]
MHPRAATVVVGGLVVCLALGAVSLMTGSTPLGIGDLLDVVTGDAEPRVASIVGRIRMPRYVAGVFVGAALAVSGAVFQSISRNALGSPDIIGFVTGSATGAVVAITVFEAPPPLVALAAVVAGLLTAIVVLVLARGARGSAGYRLILVGVGVGAFLAAVNTTLLTRTEASVAMGAQVWLTGTLNARSWDQALWAVGAVVVFVPVIVGLSRALEVTESGDELAIGVGVRVQAARRVALVCAVVLAAVATAVCGPIGFVALAAPHLARALAGGAAVPILTSAVTGSALLVGADIAAQNLPLGLRVPVALMTGVLGGFYLIWLLSRNRRL